MKNIIMAAGLMMGLQACGTNEMVTVEGKIFMKGPTSHPYVLIEDRHSKKVYKVVNQEAFSLSEKQKRIVKVRGKILRKAVGPGFPAELEVLEIQ